VSEQADYSLVLPFDSDDPEFTRGFEAGMLWERMEHTDELEVTVHDGNAEMIMRMCEARGWAFQGEQVADGWMHVQLRRGAA
jgi:hypothetical protein